MDSKPTSLPALIAYLGDHPRVIKRHRGIFTRAEFSGMENGFLWFTDEDGERRHIPIECGMVAQETGVAFDDQGFHVTKFGVTIDFLYDDAPDKRRRDLARDAKLESDRGGPPFPKPPQDPRD